MRCEPLAGSVPLQLPVAVQLAAFASDHVSSVDVPRTSAFEPILSVGAAGTVSVNDAELDALTPDALVQVSVYVVVPAEAIVTVCWPLGD
jgi:hypothetical protein